MTTWHPSKWGDPQNGHPASEGPLKTDIQQVRGPSSNNRVFFLLKHPYVTLEPLLGKRYKITGCFFFFKLSNWPLNKISESNCRAATGVLIHIDQKQKWQNIDQNICNIDQTALYRPITDHKSSLKRAYFQKAVTLFDFVIVMENLYSNHNICRTLLLYLGQNQEYRPFEPNGRLSTNGQ